MSNDDQFVQDMRATINKAVATGEQLMKARVLRMLGAELVGVNPEREAIVREIYLKIDAMEISK